MKRVLVLLFIAVVVADSNEKTEEDICRLPQASGLCLAYFQRWYYNFEEGVCKPFVYGGCRSNGNNFLTKCECEKRCGNNNDNCCLPNDQGPCRGAIRRWYYNSTNNRCQEFTYGGCQGNQNNFEKRYQCEEKCVQK